MFDWQGETSEVIELEQDEAAFRYLNLSTFFSSPHDDSPQLNSVSTGSLTIELE